MNRILIAVTNSEGILVLIWEEASYLFLLWIGNDYESVDS